MQGQSESKKHAKCANGSTAAAAAPQTKGTAMSFGFKKKLLYSTSGAKRSQEKERQRLQFAADEVAATNDRSNRSDSASSNASAASISLNQSDDNGNTTATFDTSAATSRREESSKRQGTPKLTPPRKESTGAPYRSIRFGFRQTNAVRPASTGLHPTVATFENVSNNNNNNSGNPICVASFRK